MYIEACTWIWMLVNFDGLNQLKSVCLQGLTGIYLITYLFGYEMWKFTVPIIQWSAAECFEVVVYCEFCSMIATHLTHWLHA